VTPRLTVTHISDPGCPWAWSASPALAVLQWRYGSRIAWRHVMIGLAESATEYEERGFTGARMARAYRSFRDRGMPFATAPREKLHGTWPMCRVVVATRRVAPEFEWAVFRALQFAQFTTTLDLDSDEGLLEAISVVDGLDDWGVISAAREPETEELFAADRALARSAAGSPSELQGKTAVTADGEVRYTAPSLLVSDAEGRVLEAGGFQPVDAYDVVVANLAPDLERRGVAEDVVEVLDAFPDGLTTAEVAAVMTASNDPVDLGAAEDALIDAVASRRAIRIEMGSDALWLAGSRLGTSRAGGGRFGAAADRVSAR
jgi:protein-disulfide isomerase-like protein with CxxC motif